MIEQRLDLDIAVESARRAFVDLFGLMVAHELDFRILPLLLDWPTGLRAAYDFWLARMADVVNALAHREGAESTARLSERDKIRLTNRAYTLVIEY